MKIVLAPDSFKESLTAMEVCKAIEQGFSHVFKDAEYIPVPMADGGEGTVQAMVDATAGRFIELQVTGPLGLPVQAHYGVLGDGITAVIEMASASGLHLVPESQRNPLVTTSYGTGELIRHAVLSGCKKLIIGLGGSATNDAGMGMMQALGLECTDQQGQPLAFGGGALSGLQQIKVDGLLPQLAEVQIEVACDVTNPLCGNDGASRVFGPQKGATESQITVLDANLRHAGQIMSRHFGQDVIDYPGAGAAGGMGAALLAFTGGQLKPGVGIVIDAVDLAQQVEGADLVITGEGRMDFQTQFGKTPHGVAQVARAANVPCIGIAGGLGQGVEALYEHGFQALFASVNRVTDLPTALSQAGANVAMTSRNVAAMLAMQLGRD